MASAVCAISHSLENATNALLPQPVAAQIIKPTFEAAGLGTFVSKTGQIVHAGVNLGFRAIYTASPSRRRGYVLMTNSENGEGLIATVGRLLTQAAGWTDI